MYVGADHCSSLPVSPKPSIGSVTFSLSLVYSIVSGKVVMICFALAIIVHKTA